MSWLPPSPRPAPPWYAAGLAFECAACGRCCAGPNEGYVWVSDREIAALAEFLSTSAEEVRRRYVRRVNGHDSLVERGDNHDCVFLLPAAAGAATRGCLIYAARPLQCRTWPFWPTNLSSPESWSRAAQRCPGVNRGRRYSAEEIDERRRPAQSKD
jgi:uncharacterized protein